MKGYHIMEHKANKVVAICLSWNNLNVIKDTIRRLRKETDVIVVDNGSTDGSKLYLADLGDKITYIQMGENKGSSVARNMAISRVEGDFFLIDGDIKYVPGSIKYLKEILEKYPECGIIGVNDPQRVAVTGMNGTLIEDEADLVAKKPDKVYKGFPMAWTQYGLFRNTGQKFPEEYPFDRAGMGWEDDFYYWQMKEEYNLESYFITKPLYYHDAHSGHRELAKLKQSTLEEERAKSFHDRFGFVNWREKPQKIEIV
jgi:glycosyltransferase involved in cell wall biosynthesis